MNALGGIAYVTSPKKLLPLITTTALNLSFKHGNMEESPACYIVFGQILNVMTDINLNRAPKKIKVHLKRLKRYASYNGAIYESKYCLALVDALRMKGKPKAVDDYQDAIAAAKENGFLFEQALANEGLGRF